MKGTLTYAVHTCRSLEEVKKDYENENTQVEFIENDGDGVSVHIHTGLSYEEGNVPQVIADYFSESGDDAEVFSFQDEDGETIYTEEDEE